ncbi:MAG: thiamine-phosphate kinase, partial [Acidimicrobiia bacterium]
LRPLPRVREVEVLRRHLPTAMIDISDGFAADLSHICDRSKVGVLVDAARIPVPDLEGVEMDREALELALHGGEDYELCFTIPAERAEKAANEVREATGTPISIVGQVVEEAKGRILIKDGMQTQLEARGWDHLKS